jgi:heme/copper-type cytochrome/quinol oxidase subunit 2
LLISVIDALSLKISAVNANSNTSVSGLVAEAQTALNSYLSLLQENLKGILNQVSLDSADETVVVSSDESIKALNSNFDLISSYDSLINNLFNLSGSVSKLVNFGNTSEIASTAFDSYMVANDDFLILVANSSESVYFDTINRFRLLETDTVVQIPLYTLVRLFVTSTDVLHS